jgi:nitrate reductase assembly molybdenum cofactor insertion protein NarJ
MTETVENLERRAVAFCLAARLTSWPDDNTGPVAKSLAEALRDGEADELSLASLPDTLDFDVLKTEYVLLFENGPSRCPIHETEYGRMRGMSKGNELSDIAGFFNAFGMTTADTSDAREMHDHLAVELEFYGSLLAKQAILVERGDADGIGIVQEARRKFLAEHLGRIASAVADQSVVQGSAMYAPVFAASKAIVLNECARLGAVPVPLDFYPSAAESDEMCCGATVPAVPAAKA